MGMAEYIAKRFIGKEVCVTLDEEAETIMYSEIWSQNKEYFEGFAINVEENVLEFKVVNVGTVHLNCDHIKMLWEPSSFNWRKAIKVSLTDRPIAPGGKR